MPCTVRTGNYGTNWSRLYGSQHAVDTVVVAISMPKLVEKAFFLTNDKQNTKKFVGAKDSDDFSPLIHTQFPYQ